MEVTKSFKMPKRRKLAALFGLVTLVGVCMPCVATAAYVTPWYVNPALNARF